MIQSDAEHRSIRLSKFHCIRGEKRIFESTDPMSVEWHRIPTAPDRVNSFSFHHRSFARENVNTTHVWIRGSPRSRVDFPRKIRERPSKESRKWILLAWIRIIRYWPNEFRFISGGSWSASLENSERASPSLWNDNGNLALGQIQ